MSDGKSLLEEAGKKLAHKSFFGGNKMDEAQSLYGRAGNAFKLSKQWKESGDAFYQQGQVLEKLGERDEAAGCYLTAAKSLKKEYPKEAVDVLKIAVAILTEKGRFSAAAANQKQIAEIYETDIANLEAAMDAYDQAGEWYSGEDSTAYKTLTTDKPVPAS
jgi:alpha-soluble NSF attachment protein